MKKLQKLKKLHIVLLLILIAVLGVLGLQGIKAKYTTSVSVRGNVTFSADLADSLSLYEHQANRKTDGSYELTDVKVGTVIDPETREPLTDIRGNTYQVMPGVDIPKDPQIEITGKSALDSYLYVEIEDSLAQSDASDSIKKTIQYELTDEWLKLAGVTGPNGTTSKPTSVYVYKGVDSVPMILDETFTPADNSVTPSKETTKIIKILKDDTITVGENYSSADFVLNIYAHLLQIPQDAVEKPDAKAIFTAQLPQKSESVLMREMSMRSTAEECELDGTETASTDNGISQVNDVAETPEYVTITIRYVDSESHVAVFDDYVATLHYGAKFTADVDSPTRVGYAPYIGDEAAQTVKIEEKEYTENVSYTVEYKPIQVSYIVRHYIQNVSDDSYTEYKVQTGMLETGAEPTTAELSLTELVGDENTVGGFNSLYHEPDTVAADGSTEFHVYYDRKYFLYTFDCTGGYGVDPIYARYETPLAVPDPVRPGYIFDGWEIQKEDKSWEAVDEVHAKVGLADVSYRAVWTPEEAGASYTVIYWRETTDPVADGEEREYEYWGYETVEDVSAEETVSGTDKAKDLNLTDYQYFDFEKADTDVKVMGNGSTVVNVYYTRKTYNLKFYYARQKIDTGQYEVAGGTTWIFANCGSNDIATMLKAVDCWGGVKEKPELNELGVGKGYRIPETGEKYDGYEYFYFEFRAKYGADIGNIWPVGIFSSVETSQTNDYGNYAYFSAWNVENNTYYDNRNENKTLKGNYRKLDHVLLREDDANIDTIRFLAFWENGKKGVGWNKPHEWTYNIYLPVLGDEDGNKEYNGVKYKLDATYTLYDNNTNDAPKNQTATAIEGYKNIARQATDNEIINETYNIHSYTMDFYYERLTYKLEFKSVDDVIQTYDAVPYEMPLSNYQPGTPEYPANLESNAYYFAGWYTSPECVDGTEVNWENDTMPAGDQMLYAKWAPITRTVTFSNHYQDAIDGKYIPDFGGLISHGLYISDTDMKVPSIDPEKGEISAEGIGNATNYTPIGWFYIDEVTREKKRFNPASMKVTSDLHLFMEWKSNQVVEYTIEYVIKDGDAYKAIGEPTTGYSFAGLTRTFKAKVGDELYEGYQSKYYPMEASHSILMTENKENKHIFVYEWEEQVGFKVYYIDQMTKLLMETTPNPKEGTTSDAVITEKFVPISGYMPDAYYKQMVLSYPDEKNVINFYYTKDNTHAYYVVKHMVENTDEEYVEYARIEGIGDIDKAVTEHALSISGYTYDMKMTEDNASSKYKVDGDGVTGKVTLDGLEMYIYYSRKPSGYIKRYVEYGTSKDLIESVTVIGKYGDSIYIDISKDQYKDEIQDHTKIQVGTVTYILESAPIVESTMGVVEDGNYQEIIFYYTAKKVKISYVPVCKTATENFGAVSLASEQAVTVDNLAGSTAMPAAGYRFVGWYSEADCINRVSEEVQYRPTKLPGDDTTYYALFEPILSELTIKKVVTGISSTDTFLFRVKGEKGGTANIDLTVSITGTGSVTISNLPIGNYTITELTDWSWRYDNSGVVAYTESVSEVKENEKNEAIFTNNANSKAWLGGETIEDNQFKAYEASAAE
ncbi:MAG: InlB B-repeat-containing protein [Lachnospiraceae bacterium]|nr:InlB B-repeat-containing protein [Lachnospiraceae bacterium]